MKELRDYDLAAERFYEKLEFESAPLNSWDFHAASLQQLCEYLRNMNAIKLLGKKNKWSYQIDQNEKIDQNIVIVITDPNLKIVFASDSIYRMNGYKPTEVIGNKPNMFQGEQTCKNTVAHIRNAIRNNQPFEAIIKNYRKDGSPYNCWIQGQPLFNEHDEVVNFIAYEKEVA